MNTTPPWSPERVDALLAQVSRLATAPERIELISSAFLGTPYVSGTLEPRAGEPEHLVITLDSVDCFTFLDCVEALRTSRSFAEFQRTLPNIRYRGGRVDRQARNHFFSDWEDHNAERVENLTEDLAGPSIQRTFKHLNRREDQGTWVTGLPVRHREVVWIPSRLLSPEMIQKLRTGDYIGFYAEAPGLDVTHVGIFIRTRHGEYLRHASTNHGKVLDEIFRDYVESKPGIVVLRPREQH